MCTLTQRPDPSTRSAYDNGFAARQRGCHRVLCNPRDPQEAREWYAGWDAAHLELGNVYFGEPYLSDPKAATAADVVDRIGEARDIAQEWLDGNRVAGSPFALQLQALVTGLGRSIDRLVEMMPDVDDEVWPEDRIALAEAVTEADLAAMFGEG